MNFNKWGTSFIKRYQHEEELELRWDYILLSSLALLGGFKIIPLILFKTDVETYEITGLTLCIGYILSRFIYQRYPFLNKTILFIAFSMLTGSLIFAPLLLNNLIKKDYIFVILDGIEGAIIVIIFIVFKTKLYRQTQPTSE